MILENWVVMALFHLVWIWLIVRTRESPGADEFRGLLTRRQANIHRGGWAVWFVLGVAIIPFYFSQLFWGFA